MKKQQYVFNAKGFEEDWTGCPAVLCLPTFFALSVVSLINNAHTTRPGAKERAVRQLSDGFLHALSSLVACVFRRAGRMPPRLLPPEQMAEIILNEKEGDEGKLELEHYLRDEEDRKNYRMLLRETNWRWNQVSSDCDLARYLSSIGVCPSSTDDSSPMPWPNSLRYTPLGTNAYRRKTGPALWGPYYWKIFHLVGEETENAQDDDARYLRDGLPSFLPVLVPCRTCEWNFHRHVKPSTLPLALSEPNTAYKAIHDRVTTHKTTT